MKIEDVIPANPALVIDVKEGFGTMMGLTKEESIDLLDRMDTLKKQVIGERNNLSNGEVLSIVSRVAITPQELAFMAFRLGYTNCQSRLTDGLPNIFGI